MSRSPDIGQFRKKFPGTAVLTTLNRGGFWTIVLDFGGNKVQTRLQIADNILRMSGFTKRLAKIKRTGQCWAVVVLFSVLEPDHELRDDRSRFWLLASETAVLILFPPPGPSASYRYQSSSTFLRMRFRNKQDLFALIRVQSSSLKPIVSYWIDLKMHWISDGTIVVQGHAK